MSMLIDGIVSRFGDLEQLLAYIRGLFPSSPAKYGPFRTLPEGESVGFGFAADLASGLWKGMGGVANALGDLRAAFGMSGSAFNGAFGGLQPAMATAGGSSITININNPTVRNDRDIERLASEVGDVLARQAVVNRRVGRI